jgi:hypothetical protein
MGMLVSWLTLLTLVWIGTRIDKLANVVADRGQP